MSKNKQEEPLILLIDECWYDRPIGGLEGAALKYHPKRRERLSDGKLADLNSSLDSGEVRVARRVTEESFTDLDDTTKSYEFGGPVLEVVLSKETIAYSFASIAAFVVFLRNSLGIMVDWKKLSEDSRVKRTMKVLFNGQEVEITEGTEIDRLLSDLKASE